MLLLLAAPASLASETTGPTAPNVINACVDFGPVTGLDSDASCCWTPRMTPAVTDLSGLGLSLIPGNIRKVENLNPDTVFLEDLDGDGSVGGSNLGLLARYWGLSGASGRTYPAAVAALALAAIPSSFQHSDEVELQATLTSAGGASVAFKMIEFSLGSQYRVSATDASGGARVKLRALSQTGAATPTATFHGNPLLDYVRSSGSTDRVSDNLPTHCPHELSGAAPQCQPESISYRNL